MPLDAALLELLIPAFDMPPEAAIKHVEAQGIVVSWDWQEQADIIRQQAFTVAKVNSANVLQAMHDELTVALKEGLPFAGFKQRTTDALQKHGYNTRDDGSPWRLDVIYRTNMQSAFMGARYEQMVDLQDKLPYWEYVAVSDNRTRPAHRAINGIILRSDDSFWATNYPPNGYLCRCRVRAVSLRQLKRRGIQPPTGDFAVNSSGELVNVLKVKPDVGFDHSPNERWKPDLSKMDPKIRTALQSEIARSAQSSNLEEALRSAENAIHSLEDHEEAFIFDRSGKLLDHLSGGGTHVDFNLSKIPLDKMEGTIITHNHPDRVTDTKFSSLSDPDLGFINAHRLHEIRAVDKLGRVYSLTSNGTFLSDSDFRRQWREAYSETSQLVDKGLYRGANIPFPSFDEGLPSHIRELALSRFSENIGWTYSRGQIKRPS